MAKCIGTVKINTRKGIVFAPAYAIGENFAVTAHLSSFNGDTPVFSEDYFNVTHVHSGYALNNDNPTKKITRAKLLCKRYNEELPDEYAVQREINKTPAMKMAWDIFREVRNENW